MKIKKISSKLFLLTFLCFTIFILMLFLLQGTLFEKLYLKRKVDAMESNLKSFTEEFASSQWDIKKAQEEFYIFSEKNNSNMILIDEYGKVMFQDADSRYSLQLKSGDEIYTVDMEVTRYLKEFSDMTLKEGDELYVTGPFADSSKKEIFPVQIKTQGTEYFLENLFKRYSKSSMAMAKNMKGRIISISNPPKEDAFTNFKKETLWRNAYNTWLNTNIYETNQNEITKTFLESDSGFNNIIFMKRIKVYSKECFLFSLISLQPIDEASSVMEYFIFYMVLLAFVLVGIISYVYSRLISRPLVKLTSTAKRMAELDFSVHSDVKSEDELGSLSNSLNSLSYNLDSAMDELKGANEKLLKDINRERELVKSRRQFVADASHELKTPLGIIRGYAEGIKYGVDTHRTQEYSDIIIKETEKMDTLVLDMLQLSKLQSGTYKIHKSPFNIEEMVYNVTDLFQHKIREKSLEIDVNVHDVSILGDEKKIEMVYKNLLSNSIKYTPSGGSIWIRSSITDSLFTLTLENTSENIPQDVFSKIWDRFYRIDSSRTRSSGGTGLGLSIVKEILSLHDSTFGAENTSNGVKFFFSLPLEDEKEL